MNNYNISEEFRDMVYKDNIFITKTPIIAELGVWVGDTTNVILNDLKKRERNPIYYAIDIFDGGPLLHKEALENYNGSTLNKFKENLKLNNNEEFVNIVQKSTNDASKDFPDNFFDLVYIDADHSYEAVRQDIFNWWPKVKLGGYLSGDDYGPNGWASVTNAVNSIFKNINMSHVTFYIKKMTSLIPEK